MRVRSSPVCVKSTVQQKVCFFKAKATSNLQTHKPIMSVYNVCWYIIMSFNVIFTNKLLKFWKEARGVSGRGTQEYLQSIVMFVSWKRGSFFSFVSPKATMVKSWPLLWEEWTGQCNWLQVMAVRAHCIQLTLLHSYRLLHTAKTKWKKHLMC